RPVERLEGGILRLGEARHEPRSVFRRAQPVPGAGVCPLGAVVAGGGAAPPVVDVPPLCVVLVPCGVGVVAGVVGVGAGVFVAGTDVAGGVVVAPAAPVVDGVCGSGVTVVVVSAGRPFLARAFATRVSRIVLA